MDKEQGDTHRRIENISDLDYQLRNTALHIRPIHIRRRIKAEAHEEYRVSAQALTVHDETMYPFPIPITKRYKPDAYEYNIAGIGWVSRQVYLHFKKQFFVEHWRRGK